MTKKEFVDKYAAKIGDTTKKEAERFLGAFLETVEESLAAGEPVAFVGWGKWEVIKREAREVRNPQTGDKMKVAAKKVVKFRVGKNLSEKIACTTKGKCKKK